MDGFLYGLIASVAILFILIIALVTNREATFWFARRFSSKLAIAEFDDSGRLEFKAEKSIGQGVIKGNQKFQYSMIPRNLAKNFGAYVSEETNNRYNQAIAIIYANTPQDAPVNIPPTLFNEIRNKVVEEITTTSQDVLDVSEYLNNFRCYTAGTKTAFFIRYSGKAIVVNPIVAVIASQDRNSKVEVNKPDARGKPLYARVQDLKTFFTRMITPSQISYIAQRSEMIGAKLIGEGFNLWIIVFLGILGILVVLFIFYGIPLIGGILGTSPK